MRMTEPSARVASGTGGPENRNSRDQPVTDGQEVNTSDGGGSGVHENRTSNNACSNETRPSKGKGLSVYFPDSHSMVLGYMEPPNPWKDVPTCDTNALLTAYRKGCETNGVKPLTKVQQQIHGIEHNRSRYEILSLKGEKLDYKHVESLEELFSRVQFKTLDFEATHLDDESSVALFDMIEYYESTCKLNIAFNKNIGVRGWQACARLIKKTPCLTHLDARNCDLNERMMPIIGRSLKLGSSLTSLHLENTYLSGRALLILVAALKMNETLQELFLADNKLMPSDAIQLGNLLKFNHKLYLLDLRNNHLQDVGVGHLSDGLYEQNLGRGLNTLVLWNNQITYQGMSTLARALGSTESLETLNLGHNSITNEGIHLVKEGLLKNKSLLRIGLQCTKVTCEGAVALAEYVADSRQLLRLDLRENEIKTAGLMALSLALKVNETVTKLDVDKDIKKDSGMKDYADQQRRLQMDISNFLSRNRELAIEREEEDRRKMEERARENTRLKEERERTASDSAMEDVVEYIPTCKKMRRPHLLFPADCPQQALDSPAMGGTFGDDWPDPFTDVPPSPVASINNLVSPPPGELLLSPQYCVRTKARKLFTVSKVQSGLSSPGVAGQPTVGSVTISLPNALPGPPINVLSAMQPGFSQPCSAEDHLDGTGMASDNVNSLIHQIVSEAVEMHQKSLDVDLSSSTSDMENKIDLAVSEIEQSLLVSEKPRTHQQIVNGTELYQQTDRTMNSTSDQSGQAMGLLHARPNHTKTQLTGSSNHTVHSGNLGNNISVVVETYCNNNYDRAEVLSGSISCDEGGKAGSNLVNSNHSKSTRMDPNLPDFHTSMTLNGMTRELASVLDTLDLTGQPGKGGHSVPLDDATTPDEFERELDAMLANVTGGKTFNSGSGLADVPPEAVLHEALNNPSNF